MCDPVTIVLIASAAVGAVGKISEGQQAKKAAKYNAQMSMYEAQDAEEVASQQALEIQRQGRQVEGAQKAAFGARNVARSGTALDLLSDTAALTEMDVITTRNNAAREASGIRQGAKFTRSQGAAYARQANIQAGASLLTSGAQAYGYQRSLNG